MNRMWENSHNSGWEWERAGRIRSGGGGRRVGYLIFRT
jgi:hypothetical protein